MTTKLQEANRRVTELLIPHLKEGGCLPEADSEINDAARAVVAAMRDTHGMAWLGKINLHEFYKGEDEPVIWRWHGGLVRNFAAAFVLPQYDAYLENLIVARANAEYDGTYGDALFVARIVDRIALVKGVHLHWT